MPYCSHENASLSIFNSFQTKWEWSSGVLAGARCTICNNNRRSGVLLDLVTRVGLVGRSIGWSVSAMLFDVLAVRLRLTVLLVDDISALHAQFISPFWTFPLFPSLLVLGCLHRNTSASGRRWGLSIELLSPHEGSLGKKHFIEAILGVCILFLTSENLR